MHSISLHQFLTIYAWFALSALLFLMALIARFYETRSGQITYYRWFTLPVVAFAAATVRQVHLDQLTGDVWSDVFLLIGGVSLAALCLHMYRLMTSAPKNARSSSQLPLWQKLLKYLKPDANDTETKN